MRKILPGILLGGALLLGACGGPATQNAADQAGTAIANPTTSAAIDQAATAVTSPDAATAVSDAVSQAGTAMAEPTTAAAIEQAATAVSGPEAATTVAGALGALSAVADDVTIKQGEALILDATKSAGDIKDYKWTIQKAPSGADAVVGQVIKEGSSGNVSIQPADYTKYFPTAGQYTVRLTVTDTTGQTSSDDFMIDVP